MFCIVDEGHQNKPRLCIVCEISTLELTLFSQFFKGICNKLMQLLHEVYFLGSKKFKGVFEEYTFSSLLLFSS